MKVDVRGVRIDVCDGDAAARRLAELAGARAGFVCLANVHVIETARRDERVAHALAAAELTLADGLPIAALAHRRAGRSVERVTGSDLFAKTMPLTGLRHYFLGGDETLLVSLAREVRRRYPEAHIVGTHAPPFVDVEGFDVDQIAAGIRASQANVVWVGLGAPKQELVMERLAPITPAVLVGVGAVFEFVGGTRPRAPLVFQRAGLEWAFRLVHEPRRLGRRYLITNTSFVLGVVADGIRRSRG